MLTVFANQQTPTLLSLAVASAFLVVLAGCAATSEQPTQASAPIAADPAVRSSSAGGADAAPSVTAQATVPANAVLDVEAFAMPRYQQQLGRQLAMPRQPDPRPARVEKVDCRSLCDAVEPRQSLLTLSWQDPVQSPGPRALEYRDESQIRIDISGTAEGFSQGDFSTIDLDEIRTIETERPYSMALPDLSSQVLLQRVQSGRLVQRIPGLPIFRSNEAMAAAMPNMTGEVRVAMQNELQTGALSQARVLGRSEEVFRGSTHQTVSLTGLQPGMTYRFRMVEKDPDGGTVLVEQICRVPVCPADYVRE